MACGKKRGQKLWESYQAPRTATSSKYELKDNRVKDHWKRVIKELESPYKDEKFWETSGDQVHELVGEVIYDRIRKIFNLPQKPIDYRIMDTDSTIVPSLEYYGRSNQKGTATVGKSGALRKSLSDSDDSSLDKDKSIQDVDEESSWSESTEEYVTNEEICLSDTKSLTKAGKPIKLNSQTKLGNQIASKHSSKSISSRTKSNSQTVRSEAEVAYSNDDLEVHVGDFDWPKRRRRHSSRNPYYEMLYCNESETDMINWKSNYKAKKIEISASDEFSKGIEIRTKKIAADFFKWWCTIGTKEYKSEIRKPADIEALFQLWFDEQASRGLIMDRKLLPSVLRSVATHFGALERSRDKVLEREIMKDLKAEAVPAETIAFNASLPNKMKHIPPWNNTKKIWQSIQIPEDLRSMACVWGDIRHLRSTKSFEKWLRRYPHLPVPPIFELQKSAATLNQSSGDPVHLPQDSSNLELPVAIDLTIPFTQVNIELKDVLSKLMDQ